MDNSQPLFKTIFGQEWEKLPKILQMRYANRPYCSDVTTVEGKLEISFSRIMKLFMPLFRIFNVLVPYQGKNIPVTVSFRSHSDSADITFDRKFQFPGKKECYFRSYLHPLKENNVIEFTCLGMGWRMKYSYENGKVLLQHNGYVWKLFGKLVPIPLQLLLGNIYAEEQTTSENTFRMLMIITHPLFGKMFEYGGEFKIAGTT